jgi:flagellar basal-body rod protein FlgC
MTLLNAFDITAQGINVCSKRLQAHATNVANAGTPFYVRKVPVLREGSSVSFQGVLGNVENGVFQTGLTMSNANGVQYEGDALDPTPGKKMYAPGHPQADKEGYITLSNVNVIADIADSNMASKIYEANLSVIGITKQLTNKALEIGRQQ